jgi:hypothetical protein
MSRLHELQKENDDLKTALKTIGRIVIDNTLQPGRRTDRILGILSMWECEPKKVSSE